MGAKFSSELAAQGGVVSLKLRGVVDEDNELAGIEGQLSAGITVLDLADIERINSCGVRDWVNWLGRIEKIGAKLVFVNCSPAIVAQMNLVHNFSASGIVKSFYAPYFCPRCNKERLLRLETKDLVHQTPITSAPTCRCDDCDGPMDFDDMEESYFAFLNNLKKVMSEPATEEILQTVAAASEGGAKQKTRGSSAGMTPATGPGNTPATPSTGAPSSMSPVPKTPTGRSPSGALPMPKTPPGNALSGLVSQQGEAPATSSGNHRPVGNAAAQATTPTALGSSDKAPHSSPAMGQTQPSMAKTIVMWFGLAVFLIAAIGAMIYAIAK
ncbi:MAG TPA: hypothetical protein PK493_04025 [Pseudomonadota bacterium]|nr:hypothetical protein [Pseudomonadota bacterium]